MSVATLRSNETWALAPAPAIIRHQRGSGSVDLAFAKAERGTALSGLYQRSPCRVLFPRPAAGAAPLAVLVNISGGLAGGDRIEIAVRVGAGAAATVTTQAAEKIYRSLGPDAEIGVKLDVCRGGALAWLPQETIVFDRVRLRRTIDVELARDATLLLAETVIFGRSAMGENVEQGYFFDRWRVRVDGALVFAETIRLDGEIAQRLARRAIAGDGVAVASVLKIPGDEADVAAVRALQQGFAGEVGASAWNGLAVARLVAHDGAALHRDLLRVLPAFGSGPLPRLWMN